MPSRGAEFPSRNLIRRHWRGELPLWISYWLVGPVSTIFTYYTGVAAGLIDTRSGRLIGFLGLSVLFFALLLTCWQIVGVFRAASRYSAQSHSAINWGSVARIVILFNVAIAFHTFQVSLVPQFREYSQMLLYGETIEDFAIGILEDGTELKVSGGLPFGVGAEFERIIKANPGLRLVHLNSLGGRIQEGLDLHRIIQEHGLSTYTSEECSSACTFAFLGGRNRLLRRGGYLGFHQPSFPGMDSNSFSTLDAPQNALMRRLGVSVSFIEQVNATPPDDIWYPDDSQLFTEGIVTKFVDKDDAGSLGFASFLSENINDTELSKHAIYREIELHAPDVYRSIRTDVTAASERGDPPQAIVRRARMKAREYTESIVKNAPDDAVVLWGAALVARDQYYQQQRDWSACVSVESRAPDRERSIAILPERIQILEMKAWAELVRGARERPLLPKPDAELDDALIAFERKVRQDFDISIASIRPGLGTYEKTCVSRIIVYNSISALEPAMSAKILRALASQSAIPS